MKRLTTCAVLPVYNAERTLVATLESIKAQKHCIDNVVVVDDGSTDSSGSIISDWSARLPLTHIVFPENRGLISALQTGIGQAREDLIFRIDADDQWMEGHTETIIDLARSNINSVLFASRARLVNAGKLSASKLSKSVSTGNIRRKLMWDNPLIHSAVAFRRDAYLSVGGYVGPKYAEDYDLWIRLVSLGEFSGSAKVTVNYSVSPTSFSRISRSLALATRFELQRKAIDNFGQRNYMAALANSAVLAARKSLEGNH